MQNNKGILIYTASACILSLTLIKLYRVIKSIFINENKVSIRNSILDMMKDTPLIYIKSLSDLIGCRIYAKCEYLLPYTSKDRMIKNIIIDAKNKGRLNNDSIIYEGSSGSTAYSVSAISRLLGYKCKIVVPDDCSDEKMRLLNTTGCEIIVTKQCPFSNFKDNYVRLAKKMALSDPNGFYVDQFFNTINYQTHYNETGPEIWRDLDGKLDAFVSSSGTGGTIAGVSKFLKEKNSNIKVFLGDITGSGLHSYVTNKVMFTKEETEAMRKKYRYYSVIEGIGINFLTDNFIKSNIDHSYKVSDEEAIFMANYIYEKDGIFVGGSSAVNLCAAVKASRLLPKGSIIVTMFFDSGFKYTSKLFTKDLLNEINIKSIDNILENH